jgi:hypothetical protein
LEPLSKGSRLDIQLKEEELRAYYDQHLKAYTYPEMMKIHSLVFSKERMQKAIISLRQGTDFQWLKANAEGQVDKNTAGVLNFDGNLLTTKDLSENAQKSVSGAKTGDFRFLRVRKTTFMFCTSKRSFRLNHNRIQRQENRSQKDL